MRLLLVCAVYICGWIVRSPNLTNTIENNLTLQEPLYQLRSETKDAFDEAKQLEARWKEVEREQREVYQVRLADSVFMFSTEPRLYCRDSPHNFCSCA